MDKYFSTIIEELILPTGGDAVMATVNDPVFLDFNIPVVDGFADLSLPSMDAYTKAMLGLKVDMRQVNGNVLSYRLDQLFKIVSDGFTAESSKLLKNLFGEERFYYLQGLELGYTHYERYCNVTSYYSSKINELAEYLAKGNNQELQKRLVRYQERFFLAYNASRYAELLTPVLERPTYEERFNSMPHRERDERETAIDSDRARKVKGTNQDNFANIQSAHGQYPIDKNRQEFKLIFKHFENIRKCFLSESDKEAATLLLFEYFVNGDTPKSPQSIEIKNRSKTKLTSTLGQIYKDITNLGITREYADFVKLIFACLEDEIIGSSLNSSSLYKSLNG